MNPVPITGLMRVDPTRIGGSFGAHRHAFGLSGAQARPRVPKVVAVAAPPKRILAQGAMASPELSQEAVSRLQNEIDPVVETLQLELEALKAEADMVSPQILRTEPDLYRSIQVVGPTLTPQQVRSAILVAARAIQGIAKRILGGSLSPYLSAEQKATMSTIASDAEALMRYVQQFDLGNLSGDAANLAQDYADGHTQTVSALLAASEKKVVSGEAGSVPVLEPSERGSALGAIVGLGLLVTVGILIAELA